MNKTVTRTFKLRNGQTVDRQWEIEDRDANALQAAVPQPAADETKPAEGDANPVSDETTVVAAESETLVHETPVDEPAAVVDEPEPEFPAEPGVDDFDVE